MSELNSGAAAVGASGENRGASALMSPKRRYWLRWLAGALAVFTFLVAFLPTIAAWPMFRGLLFGVLFRGLNERVSVDHLSLGWFSSIYAEGVRLQGDSNQRPALSIDKVAGNTTLWNILTGKELGEFHVVQPEIFVQFDENGSNWGRLIKELHGTPKLDRAVKIKIVDAKVLLQGSSSPQPWALDKLNANIAFSPAIANPHGVPLIEGSKLSLLRETELTPEMCNDLLKYIVPSFAGVARASGRVSLEINDYVWPIGKPDTAKVEGRLTLHSVDVSPGSITDSLAGALQGMKLPTSLKVAQDDIVSFWIEQGRVYHKDFAFGLIDLQPDRLVRTHGSVGFDQTLDVVIEMPVIGSAYLPEGALRDALMQKSLTFELKGTFQDMQPRLRLPADGNLTPVLKTLGDLLERRQDKLRENPPRPGILRNRRRNNETPQQN